MYISKDYETIFEYLKAKATELSDGLWTDFSDGDFGTIVIHLLSYWGDLLSNQLDLTASELFINTAEERTSLMEIVKLVGYEPSHYQSSIAFLDIKYNRTDTNEPQTPYTIPAYTRFLTTNSDLSFYNLNSLLLSEEEAVLTVYEGTKIDKRFGYDDIDEYGRISLNDYKVGTNTVKVEITSGSLNGSLNRVPDVRFTTGELCFSVHTSLDGIPYIQLPISWKNVVSDPATVLVTYLQTNGVDGRTGANQINRSNDATLSNQYTITNLEATIGGYNPETVSEIKTKASIFARTMYTCVTLKDFEDMSYFVDDIAQVKALDYNNKSAEFPPTIKAYKQPTPPNGVPNDAYKVLIMAVPTNTADQTIFNKQPDGGPVNYGDLTIAAKQLHELYQDRKSATLYIEYRDPIYIDPWLIMNVYMDPDDLRLTSVSQNIIDFLKIQYSRARVSIGQSLYGSRIGKDILNNFSYVDYIEIRDPEYNIEAKPYEYIDMYNGYFQLFVNDALKYVPKGLSLQKLKIGESIRVKVEGSEADSSIKLIEYADKSVYDEDNSYVPNSYPYIWSKEEGEYPRLTLDKVGVSYENNGKTMVLTIPNDMLNLGADQSFVMKDIEGQQYLHIYNNQHSTNDILSYTEDDLNIPSYVTFEEIYEDGADPETADPIGIRVTLSSAYTALRVKAYRLESGQTITMTAPNKEVYQWYCNLGLDAPTFNNALYYDKINTTYYVPVDWVVTIA